MKIIKVSEALKDLERVVIAKAIREGGILVYPTDTVYGIGCNAEKTASIEKIIAVKGRDPSKTFSVIAPSKAWIAENSKITGENVKFIDNLLPGPYTVIVKAKKGMPYVVSKEGTMGVRIPRNEFCDFIRSQGAPFITTSVNLSTTPPTTSVREIPAALAQIVDYAIDAGELSGESSRVFDITGRELQILRW